MSVPTPTSTILHNLQPLLLLLLLACQARGNPRRPREFDGGHAFSYLEQQMQFGPRIPNTTAHQRTGDWILAQLRTRADTVAVQPITHVTRQGDTLHLRNFFARFRPATAERVLFLAHWDTRPHADQSPNLGQQRLPVPGANDGASGGAVLLGVADALKAKPPAIGVDLLFTDGEDYGTSWSAWEADTSDVLIGSPYFAAHQPPGYQPLFAVLFDMVADKDQQFYYEGNSQAGAPEVVDRVWRGGAGPGVGGGLFPPGEETVSHGHAAPPTKGEKGRAAWGGREGRSAGDG